MQTLRRWSKKRRLYRWRQETAVVGTFCAEWWEWGYCKLREGFVFWLAYFYNSCLVCTNIWINNILCNISKCYFTESWEWRALSWPAKQLAASCPLPTSARAPPFPHFAPRLFLPRIFTQYINTLLGLSCLSKPFALGYLTRELNKQSKTQCQQVAAPWSLCSQWRASPK